jgi:hypothetical protein
MWIYSREGNIWVRVFSWSKRAKNPILLKRGQKSPIVHLRLFYFSDSEGIFSLGKAHEGSRISIIWRLSGNAVQTEKNKSFKVGTGVAYLSLPLLNGRHTTTPTT